MNRAPRLLLVSPVFHGYWQSIQRAFEALGYDVPVHLYDAAPKAEKVWNKLRHELPARLKGERRHLSESLVTGRAIAALRDAKPDVVLVVRGDALTDDFWTEVRSLGAIPAMWLYDEIRRMHYDIETVGERASIATYSAGDAAALRQRGVDALHVPLAYDPILTPTRQARVAEFSFIGARFERRERLLSALAGAGLPVRAYGRDWSSHPVDRIRTWRAAGAPVPAGRDLPLPEAYAAMQSSAGTLNVHGDQDGFTMRTFEACGVGAVQLIDRADVADLYVPGEELLVFDGDDDLIETCRGVLASPGKMAEIRGAGRRRTLAEHTFTHRARALEVLWGRA